MDKKTYYVSVQAGTVLDNREDAAYEFEIRATDEEVDDLIESFELMSDLDNGTAARSLQVKDYSVDQAGDNYDIALTQIYRKLYELGTEETKQTIAAMLPVGEQERPVGEGEAEADGHQPL